MVSIVKYLNNMKLIAETAWHHEGDFEFMKSLIDSISKKSMADIIKLHLTVDLDAYMTKDHPLYNDLGRWLFNKEQWEAIIITILENQKELMLLYNDIHAVELGSKYNPPLVEIHSVCLNDIYLLHALKRNINKDTTIVLGVGGTCLYEIEYALDILQNENIVLMFGFQNYPTEYHNLNFLKIQKIMRLYPRFKFGYADHTAWNEPNNILITLLGAALGMDYIEKHVTIAFGEERIDWSAAISIEMINTLREKMNTLERCLGDGLLRLNDKEQSYSVYGPMKKIPILIRDVTKGEKFKRRMMVFKRARHTLDQQPEDIRSLENKIFCRDLRKGQTPLPSDLEPA